MSEQVSIERLRLDDAPAIEAASQLLHAAFGAGGYPPERVRAFASNADTMVACARVGSAVVAVGVARTGADLLHAFGSFGDAAVERIGHGRVGILESGTVAPAWRGRGVGRAMAEWLVQWLRARGCTRAVAASWNSGGTQTSRPVLERLGFRAIAESDSERYRQTNLGARPCPVCGAPCRCSGTLYVLDLEHRT